MCKKTNYKTSNPRIDKCIRPLIEFLKREGHELVASCCGHGKYPITVVAKYVSSPSNHWFIELFTQVEIHRIRKFYKRDSEGYYYIPEVEGGK